ncbi:MAG: SH3 domain-containing protein [Oscillospiraceae bacterium]|nr:SH3 domain-containing protein [Oscillospiraceae bacterium]
MRKIILPFLTLSTLLLSALPAAASAEQAVVTGSEVNVRSGPGTAYGIFASLDQGKTVEVINRSDADWFLVSWDGSTGYVSSQFLSLLPEESPAQASMQISVNPVEVPGYINGMYVSFRAGPSTSSTVFGTYSTGKALTITGSSGEWTAVRIDGKDGFIYSQFVKEGSPNAAVIEDETSNLYGGTPFYPVNGTGSSQGGSTVFVVSETAAPIPEAAVPPEQIVQVPTDGAVQTQASSAAFPSSDELIVAPNDAGSFLTVTDPSVNTAITDSQPPAAYVPPAAPSPTLAPAAADSAAAASKIGRVTGNLVRLRSGPGTTYSIVGTYDSGTEVVISGVSGDWTAVTVPGTGISGYIHSDYISLEDQSSSAVTGTAATAGAYDPASFQMTDGFITGSSVRLREAPSMSAGILDELNFGTAVRMTGVSGDWVKVIYNGQEGFVSASFVTEGVFEPAASLSTAVGADLGKEIAAYALNYVGYPYKWGGDSPETGFDCSGFVSYVYSQFGYTTSRVANDAASDGVHVAPADLQPGDMLCFYSGNNYVGHLGIYIGDNMFVHAANSATGVVTTSLATGYYSSRGYEIRRVY